MKEKSTKIHVTMKPEINKRVEDYMERQKLWSKSSAIVSLVAFALDIKEECVRKLMAK